MAPLNLRPLVAAPAASSELAKALIVNTETGEKIPVMYNPEELKLEQGNSFAEIGIPGLAVSPVQYVRGKARVLTMDLFFDSYEVGEDVRRHTAAIVALLDKLPSTQGPPVLLFSMGRFQLQCVLVDVGQRYTMFLRDGTPVRAVLSVRLQEFVRIDVDIRRGVFFGSPTVSAAVNTTVRAVRGVLSGSTNVHVTVDGDTLSGIAAAYLGDPALWRDIAEANRIDDPLIIVPGTPLVIPAAATGTGPRGRRR
jgi:nucleoid-associated protein YgaU